LLTASDVPYVSDVFKNVGNVCQDSSSEALSKLVADVELAGEPWALRNLVLSKHSDISRMVLPAQWLDPDPASSDFAKV